MDIYETIDCTAVEKAVMELVRYAFSGTKPDRAVLEGCDWRTVYPELKVQTVASMTMDAAATLDDIIPREVLTEWFIYTYQVIGYSEAVMTGQSELTEILTAAGIPMAVLKGSAAAVNYPKPLCRNMGDIDFLVNKDDFDKAYRLMLDNGYKLLYDEDHVEYHYTLGKDGIMFEIHREPAGIARGAAGDDLRRLFHNSCLKAEKAEYGGYSFYRLPRLQNGLVLLLHIVKHLDGGLGLRQICDWYGFVKAELTDEVWETEFRPVLKRNGLEKLALTVTKMCKLYLGLDNITWCDTAKNDACAELMRFALDNGNFGWKGAQTTRTNVILGSSEDERSKWFLVNALRSLQRAGMNEWRRERGTEPIKWLAWGYVPVRYIGKILTGKRSLSDTGKLVKSINKNKSLRDKLAVYGAG